MTVVPPTQQPTPPLATLIGQSSLQLADGDRPMRVWLTAQDETVAVVEEVRGLGSLMNKLASVYASVQGRHPGRRGRRALA